MEQSLQIISEKILPPAEASAAPVAISLLRVAYDYTHNREVLFVRATNQSPLTLRSLYFDLACADDAGDSLGVAPGACLRSLAVAPGEAFGEDLPVVIPYAGTCNVELTLTKAVFADGTVWRMGDAPLAAPVATVEAAPQPTPEELAPAPEEPAPVVIPDEWLNPPATPEGYRAAIEGLTSLGDAGKPYLIKKFTALADKLEAEAKAAAEKAAAEAKAKEQESAYLALLARTPATAEDFDALAKGFAALAGYKDSARRGDEAKKKAKSIRTSEKRLAAKRAEEEKQAAAARSARRKQLIKRGSIIGGSVLAVVAVCVLIFAVILPAKKWEQYEQAEGYLKEGKYTAAIQAFEELGDYCNSADRAKSIRKELTGREDGIFLTSTDYPCFSIENGVLSYVTDTYVLTSETLKIPDYLDDQQVKAIASNSFNGLEHTKTIILPPSVVQIGTAAFADCPLLTTFKAEGLITVGAEAFRGCAALTDITLPETVTSIGEYAFQGCTALKKLHIPSAVRRLSDGLFLNCTSLQDLTFGDNITYIGTDTFSFCTSLTKINLPETVESIGNNAFLYCTSLTKMTIPAGVTSLGDKFLAGCSALTEITIGNGISQLPTRAFEGCTALKTIRLPLLTRIGYGCFNGCANGFDLYYPSTAEEFAKVEVLDGNAPLSGASFHGNNQ